MISSNRSPEARELAVDQVTGGGRLSGVYVTNDNNLTISEGSKDGRGANKRQRR
jgi:hypothetical protein